MPAGMAWGSYIKVVTASMISMLAGAAVVHNYYKPNLTIPEVPPLPADAVADENLEGFRKIVSVKKTS